MTQNWFDDVDEDEGSVTKLIWFYLKLFHELRIIIFCSFTWTQFASPFYVFNISVWWGDMEVKWVRENYCLRAQQVDFIATRSDFTLKKKQTIQIFKIIFSLTKNRESLKNA